MGGKGFAPGDPEQRRRRNVDTTPTIKLTRDDELRGPELPADVLEEPWHPQTLRWWNTWRSSPQAQTFLQTDWDFLLDTAAMHHAMWTKGRFEFASELRLRVAKLGATPEDRARLRMKVTDPDKPATPEAPKTRYGHLRVMEHPPGGH